MDLKLFVLDQNYEKVFYLKLNRNYLNNTIFCKIKDILSSNDKFHISEKSFLEGDYIEVGPKKMFKTSWNTNVLEIFRKSNINCVESVEFSVKYPNDQVPEYDKMIYEIYSDDNQEKEIKIPKSFYVSDIDKFNKEEGLGFDDSDLKYYKSYFQELEREPTNVELYDLSQCNSEHARHWFFRANFTKDINNYIFEPLMDRIKQTKDNNHNSLVSFFDNASVIQGNTISKLNLNNNKYTNEITDLHFSYKAETHNFPTSICPFPGASTGVGGRIRDTLCVGRGGEILAGTAGYSVGEIDIFNKKDYSFVLNKPYRILIEASNGASDYGNKIGEPLIQGFTRSYRGDFKTKNNPKINKRIEYLKPIMFSGGIGKIREENLTKNISEYGNLIGRVGGGAYRIGMGGGSASSRKQDINNLDSDYNAVQRGDPEMANKVVKFIRTCINLPENPILSIHDQGSGGMANVSRELAEPNGANIYLDNLDLGDKSLSCLEKWVAEYQEQVSFLFKKENTKLLEKIAKRENVRFTIIGNISDNNSIKVITKDEDILPVNMPIKEDNRKKHFYLETNKINYNSVYNLNSGNLEIDRNINFYLEKVLNHMSVCCKSFLTNKVDRSVSGLVVQQQCVGPFQLPLANNSVVKLDFNSLEGLVSAIGEQPIKGIPNMKNTSEENIEIMVRMTISEMLLNMIWTPIEDLGNINSVANWMWASKSPKDANLLHTAVNCLVKNVNYLGFSINGGKDSLSMSVDNITETIKSPNTLVLSGYSNCIELDKIVLPYLKKEGSYIVYINISNKYNLGGTIFEEIYQNNINDTKLNFDKCDLNDLGKLKKLFIIIQTLIKEEKILSGHDISDGGLITSLIELTIASNLGMYVNIESKINIHNYLFNEDPGIIIEISSENLKDVLSRLYNNSINFLVLGKTNNSSNFILDYNRKTVIEYETRKLRYLWQKRSYEIEKQQANKSSIEEEIKNCYDLKIPKFNIPENLILSNLQLDIGNKKPKIAIMSEEGSNGENEMAYCFNEVGFEVYNININDLEIEKYNLNQFRGIAFVGGFTFSDVLGAAYGWYFSIVNNPKIRQQFQQFYNREETFSLGVCNGCQLMSLLNWIPQNISLENNFSERFESRYSTVKVLPNNSIMLNGMEDLTFGIWTAHGQGRIVSKNNKVFDENTFPIRYVDNLGNQTENYPFNPNGSKGGKAAIVSNNGRHLAIMPHPERCVLKDQISWKPDYIKLDKYTPWMKMFRNAYEWCMN